MFKRLITSVDEYRTFCASNNIQYTDPPESFPCLFIGSYHDKEDYGGDYTSGDWAYPSDFAGTPTHDG